MHRNRKMTSLVMIVLILSSASGVHSQAPTLPKQDDHVYYGLYWGAAGISDVLLSIAESKYVDSNTRELAMELAIKALDGVWEHRWTDENGTRYPTWNKFENAEIYPAQKYGAAGIAKVFLKAYESTGNEMYLSWANDTIYELYAEASDLMSPHWPYSYLNLRGALGIYITDISFGSFGIIDSTLDLYRYTHDPVLLSLAVNATNWVYQISYNHTIGNETNKIIPWYKTSSEMNITYTSYTSGAAGDIPILLQLYEFTNDPFWLDWSKFLTKWLINQQREDGSWLHNPRDVLIDPATIFENGVAGVLWGLHEINQSSYIDIDLDDTIDDGLDWIQSKYISNSTHKIFPRSDILQTVEFGLYTGMIGTLRTYRVLNYSAITVEESVQWILENAVKTIRRDSKELSLVYPNLSDDSYYDLSFANGLAGFAKELLNIYSSGYSFPLIVDIPELISSIVNSFDFYQLDSGLWSRQIELQTLWQRVLDIIKSPLFWVIVISVITILVIRYKKPDS